MEIHMVVEDWKCKFSCMEVFAGRHRWVEYASKNRYNASQVPPEWHGWLHHITDRTGDEVSLSSGRILILCSYA